MNYVRRLVDLVKKNSLLRNMIGAGDASPLSDGEKCWNRLVAAGGCYHCYKKPKGFIEGPSGGMCQNVFCSQCGQGYNLTPVAHIAEEIHRDEKYIVKESP